MEYTGLRITVMDNCVMKEYHGRRAMLMLTHIKPADNAPKCFPRIPITNQELFLQTRCLPSNKFPAASTHPSQFTCIYEPGPYTYTTKPQNWLSPIASDLMYLQRFPPQVFIAGCVAGQRYSLVLTIIISLLNIFTYYFISSYC